MAELNPLFPSSNPDLKKLNEDFLAEHKDNPSHLRAGLQARQYLHPDSRKENQKVLLEQLDRKDSSLEDAIAGLELIREWDGDVKEYVAAATKQWPEATAFCGKTSSS